ncbi:MAG: hypothetical protein GF384_00445 [Elusimicrobia bacterium]|nr:hypothetical protein [Elusimicrobiota bacterium]MBD3411562.1 hypothetical protein [Elusimicrobiota bacterium]
MSGNTVTALSIPGSNSLLIARQHKQENYRAYAQRVVDSLGIPADGTIISIGSRAAGPGVPEPMDKLIPWEWFFIKHGIPVHIYQPEKRYALEWKLVMDQTDIPAGLAQFHRKFSSKAGTPKAGVDAYILMSVLSDVYKHKNRKSNYLAPNIQLLRLVLNTLKPGGFLIVGWYNHPHIIAHEVRTTTRVLLTASDEFDLIKIAEGSEPMHGKALDFSHDWCIYKVFPKDTAPSAMVGSDSLLISQ